MSDFFQIPFLKEGFALSFGLSIASMFFLLYCKNSNSKFLSTNLGIVSAKSNSNALLLGGLPVALIINLSCLWLSFNLDQKDMSWFSTIFLNHSIGGAFIILYGYLDDRFELRPLIKLSFQVFAVFIYSILTAHLLHNAFSSFAFAFLMFFGLGVVNGANLLDGLDTLFYKLYSAIAILGLAICYHCKAPEAAWLLSISLASVWGFAFFNKQPAKIYLGEIGGGYLGYTLLTVCTLIYSRYKIGGSSIPQSLGYALFLLNLPMVELGVSFLRRIYNKRSPFKGDKLHFHYILRDHYKFQPKTIGLMISLSFFSLSGLFLSLYFYTSIHPLYLYLGYGLALTFCAFWAGRKHWIGNNVLQFSLGGLFNSMRKKDILVIENQSVNEFEITILNESDPHPDPIDGDGNPGDGDIAA